MGKALEKPAREIVDRGVGEIVNLDEADNQRLAEVITHTVDLRRELGEVEQAVSDELITRMDKDLSWTWKGDGIKVSAASPTAGTENFPADALEAALEELIENDVISPEGAAAAIKRHITLTLNVPLGLPLNELADKFKAWTIHPKSLAFGLPEGRATEMPVVKVGSSAERVAAGIAALRKNPKAAELINKAAVKDATPDRRVKVSTE